MSHKTWSPSKENLLLQHLSKLERSPSTEDHKKYGSQCSINLEDNLIDLPTEPKRRRIMAEDTPSSIGSQVSSQMSSRSHSPTLSEFLDDSLVSTPSASPSGTLKEHFRRKYRKDELWAAIETNYKYLMDKGIIEACQTPESDVEEVKANSNVSFGEFLKQYKELSDWLKTIQTALQQKAASTLALSEKYLNQAGMSLSQFRNRGRAYKCRRCTKVQRKGRMVAHILKHHVPFDRVPFACSLCGFRCLEKQALMDHITKYSRHREEVSRYGTPDYKQVLHMASNPYNIGDDDMEQLSKDESLKWHARNQVSDVDETDGIFEEDEDVVAGGQVFPQWMADTLPLENTRKTPSVSHLVPGIPKPCPQSVLTMTLPDQIYRPVTQQQQQPQQLQQLTPQQNYQQFTTINTADLFPYGATNLQSDNNNNKRNTNSNNIRVNNVINTPNIVPVSPTSTPCLDEVVVNDNYLNDPLFDDLRNDLTTVEPPPKRQKTTNQEQQTEAPEPKNDISTTIMDAAKLIAEAISNNTNAITANEKALNRISDELVRVERKLNQIERVCTITQQQQQKCNIENKENKLTKQKQPLKSVVKKL